MLIYSRPMLINKYNLKLLSAVMHFNAPALIFLCITQRLSCMHDLDMSVKERRILIELCVHLSLLWI